MPSETAQAWDTVRRVREPVAWSLLLLTTIAVVVSAWQLFGLPGSPAINAPSPVAVTSPVAVPASSPAPVTSSPFPVSPNPVPAPPSSVAVTAFGVRASVVAPQFVAAGVITLPVLAVILVAFSGGLTDRARQVVQAAVTVQAVTLGLGVLSWLGALSALSPPDTGVRRPPIWFVADATYLAVAAAALIFTAAVLRSQTLRQWTPQYEDFGEEDDDLDEDA